MGRRRETRRGKPSKRAHGVVPRPLPGPGRGHGKASGPTVLGGSRNVVVNGWYADSDLGRLLKLSRERFLEKAKHKAANELVDELVAKAASDVDIERVAAMILAVVDQTDGIRELNRQISAIPGAVIAEKDASNESPTVTAADQEDRSYRPQDRETRCALSDLRSMRV